MRSFFVKCIALFERDLAVFGPMLEKELHLDNKKSKELLNLKYEERDLEQSFVEMT